MSFLQSLILGIIQGLTEFLPISSSAHLVLVPYLFGWKFPESQVFPFDVLVQIGTLVAVIIYFWSDLWAILKAFFNGLIQRKPFEDPNARMGWYLIIATIPAGLAGVLLKSKVEAAFNSPRLTAYFLFGTAALLLAAEFFSRRSRKLGSIKWFDALWIGLFQALSIFPGISRSGSTITGGMTRDLERPAAARFSFLMSIPVMIAAGFFSIGDLLQVPNLGSFLPILFVGFVAAALVGYLSIHWLLSFLNKRSLVYFAIYCILLASLVLIVSNARVNSPVSTQEEIPTPTTEAAVLVQQTQAADTGLIQVEYTSSLDWMAPMMSSCADVLDGISLVTHIVPGNNTSASEGSILLRWGDLPGLSGSTSQLGEDFLVLVVNPANPLDHLTPELARKLFSGMISTWDEVSQACADCFISAPDGELLGSAPELNFFLEGEEAQVLFERAVMNGTPVARSSGFIVPSTFSMRQSVGESSPSIGFLPARAVNDSVKIVTVSSLDKSALTQPILAISAKDPEGKSLLWLGCLQQILNP